ncbi:TKL protein kinase [Saprolegnia parasitica CBS 223.65]|uniref:TKL protein kinase n=1 Tax=Saprolegnia parasitica (strain CBS 223.65) TaxID=695850 RepID=A0A067BUK9_SAPPC|nr:TKL protein kinase [Saprolegnia parasitica CBS 223.65]KDO18297.1 TKL protein kinase [Saprolegnia parasitica CBS 223.65]|eukprot:XP_012210993.1 TKL protein kinase [Saprolegnia parasitica CBS 223.65]
MWVVRCVALFVAAVSAALNDTNMTTPPALIRIVEDVTAPTPAPFLAPSPSPRSVRPQVTTLATAPPAQVSPTLVFVGVGVTTLLLVSAIVVWQGRRRRQSRPKRSLEKPELGGTKSPVAILADIEDDSYDLYMETLRTRGSQGGDSLFMTTQENIQHDLQALLPWRIEALEVLPREKKIEHKTSYAATYRRELVHVKQWRGIKGYESTVFVGQLVLRIKLSCQQIVHLRGVAWTDTTAFHAIFEHMDGGTLQQYLERTPNSDVAWSQKLLYALDVAQALDYLHAKDITHRDLRSANVFLNQIGDAKVSNFGWLTPTIEMGGPRQDATPWNAPEVVAGHQYSVAADIYSFGMLLYELEVHGALPPSAYAVQAHFAPTSPLANVGPLCLALSPATRPTIEFILKELRAQLQRY